MDTVSLAQRKLELALDREMDTEIVMHDASAAVLRALDVLRAAKTDHADARVALAKAIDAARQVAA